MGDNDIARILKDKPITDLNILMPSQRSALVKMGFRSILEVFSLSDTEMDARFSKNERLLQDIESHKSIYDLDPERFFLSATSNSSLDRDQQRIRTDMVLRSHGVIIRPNSPIDKSLAPCPSEPTANLHYRTLKEFQNKCLDRVVAYSGELEDTLAFQLFDFPEGELDKLSKAFVDFLSHSTAGLSVYERISLIRHKLPYALVAHMADQADKLYNSQEGFWIAYFALCHLPKGKPQEQFKDVFIQSVRDLGLPHYTQSDNRNHYFYTALLNGGLSTDLWRSMWSKAIIPLARKYNSPLPSHLRGKDVFSSCEKIDTPGTTILKELLHKAPPNVVEPLLFRAYRVAEQLVHVGNTNRLLTNYDLPPNAIEGLRLALNEPKGDSAHNVCSITMVPKAKLALNLNGSCISLTWSAWAMPMRYQECSVRIFINGRLEAEQPVQFNSSGPYIPRLSIDLKPCEQYTATVQIVKSDAEADEVVASTAQSFKQNRPHCFEFIESADEVYRLRQTAAPLKRTRREAFLHKCDVQISPGPGITLHERIACYGSWKDYVIQLADVKAGASCQILSSVSGREISAWHERYCARVDNAMRVGVTHDGIDVYHRIENNTSVNIGLPKITILTRETSDDPIVRDLSATLITEGCNAIPIPFDRIDPTEEDIERGYNLTEIRLAPERCFLDMRATRCRIEVRQGSIGRGLIFSYNFILIPIANFRLAELHRSDMLRAVYRFDVLSDVDLTISENEDRNKSLHFDRGSTGCITAPLEKEEMSVAFIFADPEKPIEMDLTLAGIKLALDGKMAVAARNGTVYLDVLSKLRRRCQKLEISCKGTSKDRSLYISMGDRPLALEDPCKPGTVTINPFNMSHPSDGMLNLTATVAFGHYYEGDQLRRGKADITLLSFCPSYGLSNTARIRLVRNEVHLVFDGAARCPLALSIQQRRSSELSWKMVGQPCVIEAGSSTVPISRAQEQALRGRTEKLIQCGPLNRNDKIDPDNAIEITIEEKR